MIDEETIRKAADLLHGAAPNASVILFGSYARGENHADSDLDFLVIEPQLKSRREEQVRLRDVLRPLRIPVDVVVASARTFREWCDTPGTIMYEADKEGRVFHALP